LAHVVGDSDHAIAERSEVFEDQPTGWRRVPSPWPSRRDRDAFDRWFERSSRSVAVDLRDDPLCEKEI
jgi:hypothetical protein